MFRVTLFLILSVADAYTMIDAYNFILKEKTKKLGYVFDKLKNSKNHGYMF